MFKNRYSLFKYFQHGHTELVKLLLDNHAEVADQDLLGNTGLHYACYTGINNILVLDKHTILSWEKIYFSQFYYYIL